MNSARSLRILFRCCLAPSSSRSGCNRWIASTGDNSPAPRSSRIFFRSSACSVLDFGRCVYLTLYPCSGRFVPRKRLANLADLAIRDSSYDWKITPYIRWASRCPSLEMDRLYPDRGSPLCFKTELDSPAAVQIRYSYMARDSIIFWGSLPGWKAPIIGWPV